MRRSGAMVMWMMGIAAVLTAQDLPPGFVLEEVASGLDQPTALAFTQHDQRIFITEKTGSVRIIEDGILLPEPFYTVTTEVRNERGLLGIALDPDFETNQYVYLYHTVKDARRNRLIRVTAAGNTALPQSEVELYRTDPMWAAWHNGGAILFDEEKRILLAVGDGTSTAGQRPEIELAHIIRINRDGSVPTDNPTIAGIQNHVYAYGVRNPYTMASSTTWGRTFFNDVGNEFYEEINELLPGANYGWDRIDGFLQPGQLPPEDYVDPLYVYEHTEDGLCAIVGAAFYEPGHYTFPAEYHAKFFFMDYCEGTIFYLDPPTNAVKTFASGFDFPNNLGIDHDGHLFIMQLASGQLFRIRYQGNGAPYISRQPQSQVVPRGDSVSFSVRASGDQPLQYQWSKDGQMLGAAGDQLTISDVTASDAGAYQVHVSNSAGIIVSNEASLRVVLGEVPNVTITAPDGDQVWYSAGDSVFFSGMASDLEDGILSDEDLQWSIEFHHDQHTHPALSAMKGSSGSYHIPVFGETDTTVFYRIALSARDSDGLMASEHVDVHPNLVSMQLETHPECIVVGVDGAATLGKSTLRSLDKMMRSVEMPRHQVVEDHLWNFVEWHDGAQVELQRLFEARDGLTVGAEYEDLGFYHNAAECGVRLDFYHGIGSDTTFYLEQNRQGINENWDVNSPWRWRGDYPQDTFSIKWSGQLVPPIDATYTFELLHDGLVTFTLAGQTLLDRVQDLSDVQEPATVTADLKGGSIYDLSIFYEHLDYISRMQLAWSYGPVQHQVIPDCHFQLPQTSTSSSMPEEARRFDLYPTPVRAGNLTLFLHDCRSKTNDLYIYDTSGKLLHQQPLEKHANSIDVRGLRAGVYMAVVKQDQRLSTQKMVIVN